MREIRDPFRLRVLKAMSAAIKGVTPANGCRFDLSDTVDEAGRVVERVARGRAWFTDADPLPLVSLLEDPRPIAGQTPSPQGSPRAGTWHLIAQGFVRDDPENPTDPAHRLVAEVTRALLAGARAERGMLLGEPLGARSSVRGIEVAFPLVRPPEEGVSDVAYFALPIVLTVVEDLARPFD